MYSTDCSCQILIKLDRRTDGQTYIYMTNITPALRSIANAPNKRSYFTEETTWVHYKDNRLMLLRKISVIYCMSCMKHIRDSRSSQNAMLRTHLTAGRHRAGRNSRTNRDLGSSVDNRLHKLQSRHKSYFYRPVKPDSRKLKELQHAHPVHSLHSCRQDCFSLMI
jgi:hypothetical protein